MGTDEERLVRLMVSRSRQDLTTVAEKFQEKYDKSLEEFIEVSNITNKQRQSKNTQTTTENQFLRKLN